MNEGDRSSRSSEEVHGDADDPRARRKTRRTPRTRSRLLGRLAESARRSWLPRRRRAGHPTTATKAELEPFVSSLTWQRPPEAPRVRPPRVVERELNILMIGWEWPPSHSGGLGVHSFELCQELARMGHRITFALPFRGPRTEIRGVSFRTPGDSPLEPYPGAYEMGGSPARSAPGDIERFNAWITSLSAVGFDVVHAHDWFGTEGASRISRRDGRPFVLTIHSTEYDRSLGHPWREILQREQFGIDEADRVIAVSRHLKEQLVERYRAPPGKIRVIYNAVRPSERLAPLEAGRKVVLYLARLAAMKGVDTFLRAAARVAPTEPGVLFVVAGEGPEYPRLLQLAALLEVSDRVLFLGKVTDEERATLLASASVFVLPSIVEPFGIAALEAMAAGVPAIVSKTSGVAEITSGVFTVDFWDIDEFASRIGELLAYPVLRRAMGEEGRISATREGWEERAIQTAGVYLEAASRFPR